jgi:hypothetical protein
LQQRRGGRDGENGGPGFHLFSSSSRKARLKGLSVWWCLRAGQIGSATRVGKNAWLGLC